MAWKLFVCQISAWSIQWFGLCVHRSVSQPVPFSFYMFTDSRYCACPLFSANGEKSDAVALKGIYLGTWCKNYWTIIQVVLEKWKNKMQCVPFSPHFLPKMRKTLLWHPRWYLQQLNEKNIVKLFERFIKKLEHKTRLFFYIIYNG